jgi:AcrR family transcriptional regulator
MGRWEPDAQGRLRRAALELFDADGFEQTTVAEIAARAGVTERTFFRYFADKREVLFGGSAHFEKAVTDAVAAAPPAASPLDAATAGLDAAAAVLPDREYALQRHTIIQANTELRERELIKMASLAASIAQALRERGVDDATATLTAETAIAVFRVAYDRWLGPQGGGDLTALIGESLGRLRVLAAG